MTYVNNTDLRMKTIFNSLYLFYRFLLFRRIPVFKHNWWTRTYFTSNILENYFVKESFWNYKGFTTLVCYNLCLFCLLVNNNHDVRSKVISMSLKLN